MKKIISVLLSVLMVFGAFSVAASAAEGEDLVITVVNDTHYNAFTSVPDRPNNSVSEDFAHVNTAGRLYYEADAIFKAFLADVAENESKYLLIVGDITETGTPKQVEDMVAMLSEFEASTGKEVFVVPGNHDVLKNTKAQFMADYADFGYKQAIEIDDKSASYIVDLDDEYRLIAIDATTEGTGAHSVFEERLQWIAEQGEKAKADGKKLIAMHHQNFIDHMILSSVIQPGGVVTAKNEAAIDVYAKAGIKYVFTGHTHDHDIASVTASDGTVIYDAVTGSLGGYGTPYRVVTFADDVKFETRRIEKINVEDLPEKISANAVALAESNFTEYQKTVTDLSYAITFNQYTKAKTLKSLLKLEDEEMNAIIDKVGDRLNYVLNMPFEKENEAVKGDSIEAIVEQYNTTIPDTDYENMIDLAVTLYQAHNYGDENYPAYSDEIILFSRGLAATLSYALSEVSAEEYAKVLSFLTGLLGVEIPVDFLIYAGDGIKRFEGIEILITTAILPVMADFTTDRTPADSNVTLPGYEKLVEENNESFWEKVISFFKMIYAAVRTLLAFLPEWK